MRRFKSNNIFDKYTDMIYHIALGRLRNEEDAKDIVQEVFLYYIKHTQKVIGFNSEEHEKAWIIRVTTNLCYNHLKSASNSEIPLNSDIVQNQTFNEDEINIFESIKKLTDKYRKVFELFYISGFKIPEISRTLNISESAVKTRLKRARDTYRRLVSDGGE